MTKGDNPKETRKQAEEKILKDMRGILDNLAEHKATQSEPVDRKKVMSVITRFMELKRSIKIGRS